MAEQRDVVLAAKLHVPGTRSGFVARPRLHAALDAGTPLTLVIAPAGFGKTALLAHWAAPGGPPPAWLSLDEADNDPARFWRYLVAAVDRVRPGTGRRMAPWLDSVSRSWDGLVTALLNDLDGGAGDDPVRVILDDYHLIENPEVHRGLGFLIGHAPASLRLVLSGRADPPLPLARMRARGQLTEVRVADLRFSRPESAALLRQALDLDLPGPQAAALADRTEGWAAGLHLAALSLRGQSDTAGFVAQFSGSHRFVLDYLAEEVLEVQAEPIRGFLLRTSVLDRLNGDLCDAVTGGRDGAAMLETVERAGLFLVPLDETRRWWRYHQLFADLLRARLRRQWPDEVASLHRAAAGWYERHGLPDDAIRHALASGRAIDAARLVERHVDALLIRGERDTAQRWLAALPPDLSTSRPRLLLARSRVALHGGRLDGVSDLLDAAERAAARPRDPDDEPYEPSAGLGASLLANIPATIALDRSYLAALLGDAERTRTLAADALAAAGEREWMLASNARGYLGIAEWLRGDLPAAERILRDTVAQWRAAGELNLAARGAYHLGQVLRAGARLDAAAAAYRQILQIAAAPDGTPLPAAGMGHVGLAEVAYERGDLAAAEAELAAGLEPSRQFLYTQPLATGLATLARVRQARGDTAGAREAMDEAADATAGSAATGLLDPVPALRARLQLAQGDLAGARGWLRRTGLREDAEPRFADEPAYLVLARVLLADGHTARATALLDRLLTAAAAQHRIGSVLEIQAVRALALAAAGRPVAAAGALVEALALACPQGCQAVFVEEGEPMATLLGGLVAAPRAEVAAAWEVPLECLAGLLRAMADRRPSPARPAPVRVSGLVEPLTVREREVLELLAAGMSNQDIAGTLVVTLDTVKKHVTHILTKLGATNRTEAVARARRLGLLA